MAASDSTTPLLSVTGVTNGSNGTVTIIDAAAGTVQYTPNADFNGSDSFTYTVTTAAGDTETATVNVTVNPPANQAPNAVNDNGVAVGLSDTSAVAYDPAHAFRTAPNSPIDPATMEEFRENFYMILNVAMGGTLGSGSNPPDGTETWPQTMLVDWVRVYQ